MDVKKNTDIRDVWVSLRIILLSLILYLSSDFNVVIVIIAITIIFFYRKIGVFFNPVSLFCLSFGISIVITKLCEELDLLRGLLFTDSLQAIYYYKLSIIVFCLPWLFVRKQPHNDNIFATNFSEYESKKTIYLLNRLSVILAICVLVSFYFLGGVPMFKMITGETDINEHNRLIESLPLGLLAIILNISFVLTLLVSSVISNRKQFKISNLNIVFIVVILIIAATWQGKRQGLLVLIFLITARLFQNKINFLTNKKTYVLLTFGVLLFMILFSNIASYRNFGGSSFTNDELLKYAMYPVMNMAAITKNTPINGHGSLIPLHTFQDFVPYKMRQETQKMYTENIFEPTSPSGYLAAWYLDYGRFGVILGTLILSLSALHLFMQRTKSEKYMRYYVFILWCCATVNIYAHFISLNFFILPFIIIMLIDKVKISV